MHTNKPCTKCKKVYNLCEFNNSSSAKDGKRSQCRACDREAKRSYRLGKRRLTKQGLKKDTLKSVETPTITDPECLKRLKNMKASYAKAKNKIRKEREEEKTFLKEFLPEEERESRSYGI